MGEAVARLPARDATLRIWLEANQRSCAWIASSARACGVLGVWVGVELRVYLWQREREGRWDAFK